MADNNDLRPLSSAKYEEDVPPQDIPKDKRFTDLTPNQKIDWQRWLLNLNFVKYLLSIMIFLYLCDFIYSIFISKQPSSLQEPFFEILKTILFTVSGYVLQRILKTTINLSNRLAL